MPSGFAFKRTLENITLIVAIDNTLLLFLHIFKNLTYDMGCCHGKSNRQCINYHWDHWIQWPLFCWYFHEMRTLWCKKSLRYVNLSPWNEKSALVPIFTWRRTCASPLPEQLMTRTSLGLREYIMHVLYIMVPPALKFYFVNGKTSNRTSL